MNWDVIVIGATGGVGSAALYECARRGVRVLGFDRFAPGHGRGSSHGESRVIRKAYFEHVDYVALLHRAYERWHDLNRHVPNLFMETGVLEIGPEDGEVVPGVLEAAKAHGLAVDPLDADGVTARFPQVEVPTAFVAVFEPDGGVLKVSACCEAHNRLAKAHGATLITTEVDGWLRKDNEYVVFAGSEEYRARSLIVSPGPWAPDLLAGLTPKLQVKRKVVAWFDAPPQFERTANSPVWLYELPDEGVFYGFPAQQRQMKAAEHTGGAEVDDPLEVDRTLLDDDLTGLQHHLSRLQGVDPTPRRYKVCMYTMTPDTHFVVGGEDGLAYTAGLSGHGFKMTNVLGEIMTDLALNHGTDHPIALFAPSR